MILKMGRARDFFIKIRPISRVGRDSFEQFFRPRGLDPRPVAATCVVPTQDVAQAESSVPIPEPEYHQPDLVHNNSPLENLPAEIRHHLLSRLDLEGPNALLLASPVYFQQYLQDREHLLCECFETTLGSVAVDADAVYQSGLGSFSKRRTPASLMQLLQSYRDRRSLSVYPPLKETFTMDEITSMVSFHLSIIMPLSRDYTGWTLGNLTKETKKEPPPKRLSRTEETRLVRALYRYQLYCNLFGAAIRCIGALKCYIWSSDEDEEMFKMFLCIYKSWEIEEIACIYAFVTTKIDSVLDEIRWDVHKDNPRFEGAQRPPTPKGAFDLAPDSCQFCIPFSSDSPSLITINQQHHLTV